ncbi:translation initiation factor IF-2-like [Triticum aestivum]|uniref:translation initiation factor IF-2-like n=1 Tax=Triticum aestivum TaxID=4565 RepID=UPI001D02CF53|nr:translation initiation factor IF-2-like [Triticum aestivum]
MATAPATLEAAAPRHLRSLFLCPCIGVASSSSSPSYLPRPASSTPSLAAVASSMASVGPPQRRRPVDSPLQLLPLQAAVVPRPAGTMPSSRPLHPSSRAPRPPRADQRPSLPPHPRPLALQIGRGAPDPELVAAPGFVFAPSLPAFVRWCLVCRDLTVHQRRDFLLCSRVPASQLRLPWPHRLAAVIFLKQPFMVPLCCEPPSTTAPSLLPCFVLG